MTYDPEKVAVLISQAESVVDLLDSMADNPEQGMYPEDWAGLREAVEAFEEAPLPDDHEIACEGAQCGAVSVGDLRRLGYEVTKR